MLVVPGTEKANRPMRLASMPRAARYALTRGGAADGSNLSSPSRPTSCQMSAVGSGSRRTQPDALTSRNLVREAPTSTASTLSSRGGGSSSVFGSLPFSAESSVAASCWRGSRSAASTTSLGSVATARSTRPKSSTRAGSERTKAHAVERAVLRPMGMIAKVILPPRRFFQEAAGRAGGLALLKLDTGVDGMSGVTDTESVTEGE